MKNISPENIRRFRLHTHHLDRWYQKEDVEKIAGACGLQNSPPGAWEHALGNRIPGYTPVERRQLLEEEKTLVQAWSFRGAPVVFPVSESGVFLSALAAKPGEPWIYTRGIQLALDFMQMSFEELLPLLVQVLPGLDGEEIQSKTALDQTLADWVAPLLPGGKRDLWNAPSLYGSPDKQTVGGAVVSFLLRPCAFMGLVVFGRREGSSPTFTSYRRWVGHPLEAAEAPEQKLVRKYLHCYGPASVGGFANWLGCSPAQAKRLWQTAAKEMEPIEADGKKRFILADDSALLAAPPQPERPLHLLGPHDPYLGLPDREVILESTARQRQIWQTVSNPGAVLWQGKIAGLWKSRKKGSSLEIDVSLWEDEAPPQKEIQALCAAYAEQQQLALKKVTFSA